MMWKIITGIGVIVGLISAIFALDSRYATPKDLQNVEIKLVQNLDTFGKEQQKQFKMQRYDQTTDSYYRYKALEKTYPNDQEIKNDLKALQEERNKLQNEINTPVK